MVKLNSKFLLILLLLLSGCAEEPVVDITPPIIVAPRKPIRVKPQAAVKPHTAVKPNNRDVFIVKQGDTLYSIGFGSGLGYELLSEWNNIPKPYKLYVGQSIKLYNPSKIENQPIPPVNNTVPPRAVQPSKTVTQRPPRIESIDDKPNKSKLATITIPAEDEEISADSKDKQKILKLYWKWPIQGKILKSFAQSGNKGIDIEGKAGESVLASANGEVVYSGNGLIGYGNLLIIKHDDLHLSAYANNAALQVNEGQKVTQGQVIARCGKSASGIPSLHFEIRKNGKSVNPLLYLPTP